MNVNKLDIFEDSVILTGIGISLVDIQTIMSIILLSFNILWLLIKFIVKLKDKLKDGNLTPEEIKDLENDIDNINDKFKRGDK